MIRLAIGLLVHNEADVLPRILEDLRRQSVFSDPERVGRIDLFVVPNGCTDDSADTARRSLGALQLPGHAAGHVESIGTAGKTNAWNVFMQDMLPADATHVVMLDADIRIPDARLIERALDTLAAHPEAMVASDVSVKHFEAIAPWNPMRLLNLAFQNIDSGRSSICGQFYCARAPFLRRIALPAGLLSQDGYLSAMIRTDALTRPATEGRIRRIPDGWHLHPAYTRPAQNFRYQKRQAIGTAIYLLVYAEMERMPPDMDLRMDEIRRRNRENPDWLAGLIAARAAQAQPMVPPRYRLRKWHGARALRGWRRIKWLLIPVALAYDALAVRAAEAELRSGAVGSPARNQGRFRIREDRAG